MLTADQRRTEFAMGAGIPLTMPVFSANFIALGSKWPALITLLAGVGVSFVVGYCLWEDLRQKIATTKWHRAAYRMILHPSRVAPLDPDGRPTSPRSPSPANSFITWTALAIPATLLGTWLLLFDRPWPALGPFLIGELAAFHVGYLLYGDLRHNGLTTPRRRAARYMFRPEYREFLTSPDQATPRSTPPIPAAPPPEPDSPDPPTHQPSPSPIPAEKATTFTRTALATITSSTLATLAAMTGQRIATAIALIGVAAAFRVGYLLYADEQATTATTPWHRVTRLLQFRLTPPAPDTPENRHVPRAQVHPSVRGHIWGLGMFIPLTCGTGVLALIWDQPRLALYFFLSSQYCAFHLGNALYQYLYRCGITTRWERAASHLIDHRHRALLTGPDHQ